MNRITEILNGRRAVTGDTALRLGRFFGTTGEFWLNLQKLYERRCAEWENGSDIARLPTLPIASSGEDETMESRGGGSASGDQAMPNVTRKMVGAEEVLVLDSSTMAFREQGHFPSNRFVVLVNIDRQDRQDKKRLRAMLTGSMIGCAFEVIHEPGSEFVESATEKAMIIGLSEARLSVQSHNTVKVRFREKPVGDNTSCLSCPSM